MYFKQQKSAIVWKNKFKKNRKRMKKYRINQKL